MDSFDMEDGDAWEEKEGAGEPAGTAERGPGARRAGVCAPGGRARPSLMRRLPHLCSRCAVAPIERTDPSLRDIYKRYQALVRCKLRRRDVEPAAAKEILQEVFLTMNRILHEDRLPKNVAAMLTTITTHQICNHLRRPERRLEHIDDAELEEAPASQLDVEQGMRRAERKQLVEDVPSRSHPDRTRKSLTTSAQ